MGGSKRYILNIGTIIGSAIIAFLLLQKYSQITVYPYFKSLFSDIFFVGKSNWPIDIETTVLYQLWDVSEVDEWFVIFLPLLSGLAFVGRWCDDFHTRQTRNMIVRMGKKGYIRRCFLWANISFIVIGILTLLFYTTVVCIGCNSTGILKTIYDTNFNRIIMRMFLNKDTSQISWGLIWLCVVKSYGMILVGIITAGNVTLIIGAITKNKYVSLCVPTLFFYLGCRLSDLVENLTLLRWVNPVNWFNRIQNEVQLLTAVILVIVISRFIFCWILEREVEIGAI